MVKFKKLGFSAPLTVLTTSNRTLAMRKRISKFKTQISCLQYEASFLSSPQTKHCASLTTNTKILLYKFSIWFLFVKPACVNAAIYTRTQKEVQPQVIIKHKLCKGLQIRFNLIPQTSIPVLVF